MFPVITKNTAKINGLSKYFTGIKCRRGHITHRYTATGACVNCVASYGRRKKKGTKLVQLTFYVNPEDVQSVRDFVEAVNSMREFDK